MCGCCYKSTTRNPFGLDPPVKDYISLGINVPMYFKYIQHTILLMLSFFLIDGAYELFTNLINNDCLNNAPNRPKCEMTWHTRSMLINKRDDRGTLLLTDGLGTLAVLISFVIWTKLSGKVEQEIINLRDVNVPENFGIMLRNVPETLSANEIREFFTEHFGTIIPHKIVKINWFGGNGRREGS